MVKIRAQTGGGLDCRREEARSEEVVQGEGSPADERNFINITGMEVGRRWYQSFLGTSSCFKMEYSKYPWGFNLTTESVFNKLCRCTGKKRERERMDTKRNMS